MSNTKPAKLILQDGKQFHGYAANCEEQTIFGEAVFTTGMVGYPEALTDPSYAGQLLCFTYPLIGNYGTPPEERWQSEKIQVSGVIVDHLAETWSHYEAKYSLAQWLEKQNIPIIYNIDTRTLTLHLRKAGTMAAAITTSETTPSSFPNPLTEHLVARVSPTTPRHYPGKGKKVIAVDCGMKEAIVRHLTDLGADVKRVPHDYDYSEEEYDGLFLSNGPGDPTLCRSSIAILQKAMQKQKPIFGICLGSQLLALAAGASTYKLPYGHRGHNQPCMELATKRCFMTSQNHGFAVEEKSLPNDWTVTHKNLNDDSVEGIAHKTLPFSAVQFHPEACPGPIDTTHLFTQFLAQL